MDRRALLATVGSLGVAGCIDTGEPPRGDSRDWPDSCPSFDEDVVEVHCTAPSTPRDTPVVMGRSTAHATLPIGTLSFTLRNEGSQTFTTNFWEWHVHKYVDGRWFHIAPRFWHVPAMDVASGESHTWTLTVDNTKLDGSPLPTARGTKAVDLAGLGGGQYAFGTTGWFEDGDHEYQTGVAALFELDGPGIELRPTDEVTAVKADGETVTVRAEREDLDQSRIAAFELTRTDDPEGQVREYIVEMAMRNRRLRNTLPFFESGVERVRLVEPNSTYPPFGVNEPRAIAYGGETYQITAEVLENE